MKKILILLLSVIFVFGLVGCNRSMNFIIENEPRISGIVTEVYDNSIIIHGEPMEGYPSAWDCSVSLDVENKDSYTNISVGDEVVVYYNGDIAESDPLQINTVYAITLKTPASRMENNDSANLFTMPPELVVLCGGEKITALRGTYSWEYKNEDGTYTGIEADSMHPLDSKEYMTDLPLAYSSLSAIDVFQAYLQFDIAPDEVEIRYWSADCWNKSTAESEELEVQAVEVDLENGGYTTNYTVKLLEGNYIYEVIAKWSSSEEYSGTAHYSFYTIMGDYEIVPIQG